MGLVIVTLGGLSPLLSLVVLLAVAFAAGAVGAALGVGGGLFLVPALVLLFGVDIHVAIAASIVSVIATSSAAASNDVQSGLTNVRLAMFLETATAVGGLVGAVVAVTILAAHSNILVFAFVPVVLIAAALMASSRDRDVVPNPPDDPLARRLRLEGEYVGPLTGIRRSYRVTGTRVGLVFAGLAGISSGLLGIGGGIFKVPAMNTLMNVPLRVATATSTFMIGVTAAAGALVYLFAGDVVLGLVAPVVLAVFFGTIVGRAFGHHAPVGRLKVLFVGVLVLAAVLMVARGVGAIP
ncbi:MAG: sulfite exporter TauE/SafE family protein [Thermoplasmata archaeon]|nr:sulfite exporter TauE/SafE family protein [Thermoplasmata archaeon]MCI4361944.1 sulfite exporter TauE/SafE family protein [Thermoplasmata archaeon]